jgi:hypothetical protein
MLAASAAIDAMAAFAGTMIIPLVPKKFRMICPETTISTKHHSE